MRACVLLPALIFGATSATAQDIDDNDSVGDDVIPAPVILSAEAYVGPQSSDTQAFDIITFEPVASATLYRVWRQVKLNYTHDESRAVTP